MRIALLSDLHLEFGSSFPETPEADVLVLAGDFTTYTRYPDRWAIQDAFEKYLPPDHPPALYIFGNHEWYGGAFQMNPPGERICFYRDDSDIAIVAATLWTDPDPSKAYRLNDFYQIEGMTPEVMARQHQSDKEFLCDEIDKCVKDGDRVVVVTHHLPSPECVAPEYKASDMNSFFASSTLEDIWQPSWDGKVLAWLYGHTHTPADFTHSYGVRMVCNPYGYYGLETTKPPEWKVIEV